MLPINMGLSDDEWNYDASVVNPIEEKTLKESCIESVFIEITDKNNENQIYGCIYRHPCMDMEIFNGYLENLLKKLDKEKKLSYLTGDFNMDLLQIDTENKICDYYDILTSHLFVPHITLPTRITSKSKTLITINSQMTLIFQMAFREISLFLFQITFRNF